MIGVTIKGDWKKTNTFIERALNLLKLGELDRYGKQGVRVLSSATPKDTGKTANSWYYQIVRKHGSVAIVWCNSNASEGIPIVILLQYGHANQNGVYLKGVDFINPAMRKTFNEIRDELWKELTK